jgi:hypothetical protein
MASGYSFAFILLVVFQIKHFLGDFPLQTQYMLRLKSAPGMQFVIPLAVHCLVHAGMTLAIVCCVNAAFWWLAGIDFIVHFLMDRIKSGPQFLGRYNDIEKSAFWNILGFDQMVHHLTGILIVWMICRT